jgi:transposase
VWRYHGLTALGVRVICIDARHAKSTLQMQVNKTDENDAEGIAQIMRTGWFRAVHVTSFQAQLQRSLLLSRFQLVNMRRDASNQVRGALKVFGIVLPAGRLSTFDRLAREYIGVRAELSAFVEPLLAAWRSLGEQVQSRFKKSRNVGAHLGLAPRRFQSGEMDRQGSRASIAVLAREENTKARPHLRD